MLLRVRCLGAVDHSNGSPYTLSSFKWQKRGMLLQNHVVLPNTEFFLFAADHGHGSSVAIPGQFLRQLNDTVLSQLHMGHCRRFPVKRRALGFGV